MKATDLLRQEHEMLRMLLSGIADPEVRSPEERRLMFKTIKEELECHARLEEEILYRAVVKLRSRLARSRARDGLEGHHDLDALLAELDQMEPDDPLFMRRLQELREVVDHHIREEEEVVFAHASSVLSEDRLERLGHEIERRRSLLGRELVGAAAPRHQF